MWQQCMDASQTVDMHVVANEHQAAVPLHSVRLLVKASMRLNSVSEAFSSWFQRLLNSCFGWYSGRQTACRVTVSTAGRTGC